MRTATTVLLAVIAAVMPHHDARQVKQAAVKKHRHHRRPRRHAVASWYGPGFYGGHLACGGTLSPATRGVANKSLPCWSRVRICATRCEVVPVIDRGPYVSGRTFDLTRATANDIGFPFSRGYATVAWGMAR